MGICKYTTHTCWVIYVKKYILDKHLKNKNTELLEIIQKSVMSFAETTENNRIIP